MYLSLFITYIILTVISLRYTVNDILPEKVDYIVVISATTNSITLHRIKHAIELSEKYKSAKIIACGKFKEDLFNTNLSFLEDRLIIQSKSTNTYEDALYTKELVKNTESIILVTSHSHQIRSYRTFLKFFQRKYVFCSPTNDVFTLYSPFLPTGWIATFVNFIKNRKYNS